MQFQEGLPPQGLSEARRGSAVFCKYIVTDTTASARRLVGRPAGGNQCRGESLKRWHRSFHYAQAFRSLDVQFSWEILKIFFLTLFGDYGMILRPAAAASPLSDNSREGNTTPSQSEGAVRGDRHCPLRRQVLYHFVENSGVLQSRKN